MLAFILAVVTMGLILSTIYMVVLGLLHVVHIFWPSEWFCKILGWHRPNIGKIHQKVNIIEYSSCMDCDQPIKKYFKLDIWRVDGKYPSDD